MTHIIYSLNETAAFRHFFHYHYFIAEAREVTAPDQQIYTENHYEAELTAYDYKEYRNGLPDMAGNDFKGLPSGN